MWPTLLSIFSFEIFMIGFNIMHTLFFLWVNVKAKQFHQNWTNIMSVLYIQHTFADLAWMSQRFILVSDYYEGNKFYSTIYLYCSYIRVGCLFQGIFILPFLVAERYFATYYLSDYEKTPRLFISRTLILIIMLVGVTCSYTFHKNESSVIHCAAVLVFNGIGVLGNIILLRINIKYLDSFRESRTDFTLGARYQISENIRTCRMVNFIVLSMGGFNALICISLLMDNFDFNVEIKSMNAFLFDGTAIMYSTTFPYICIFYSTKWRQLFKSIFNKLRNSRSQVSPSKSLELRNTFGVVMSNVSADLYFQDLAKSWNNWKS